MSTDERKALFLDAIKRHDLSKMQELIDEGVNINELDEFGLTPLHFAVISGFDDEAKLLLEKGAQVNSLSSRNTTPLHHAAKGGHIKCLEVLLEHNADVMIRDESTTPFGYAVKKGHIQAARALIAAAQKQGGDEMKQKLVNLVDSKGETPLMLAVSSGNMEFIQELVNAGASMVKDATETTAASCILSSIKFDAPLEVLSKDISARMTESSVFIEQIAALREEGSAVKTDFVLTAKNGNENEMNDENSIAVHKAIIAARSSFFAKLLKEKPDTREFICDGVTVKQLAFIVDWIYKNTVTISSFSDMLAVYGASLRLFQEDVEKKEATPLFVIADFLARSFTSVGSVKEAWKTVWDESSNDHETVKVLRQHALFFALNKLTGAEEDKELLDLLKLTPSSLLAETFSKLKVYTAPKEIPAKPAAVNETKAPTPAAVTAPVAASAGVAGTNRVELVYSRQCPQDVKDDIAASDSQIGDDLLNQIMTPGQLSLARKMVTAIVKNSCSNWFRVAVDEERDGAPGYYSIIKHPMDLTSLRAKYLDRKPQVTDPTLADFLNDGRTIWQNALMYNVAGSQVFDAAVKLSKAWEKSIRSSPWGGADAVASHPQGMKRPSPAPARSSVAVAPMTPEELSAMSKKIMDIQNAGDTDALMKLVKMANANPSSGEVELDFSKLSPEILRRMEAFVNTYQPKK